MNSLIKSILLITFSLGLSFSQQSVMDDEGIYLMCEKMPELIGGMDGLQKKNKIPITSQNLGRPRSSLRTGHYQRGGKSGVP